MEYSPTKQIPIVFKVIHSEHIEFEYTFYHIDTQKYTVYYSEVPIWKVNGNHVLLQ